MYQSVTFNANDLARQNLAEKEEVFVVLYTRYVRAVFNSAYRITNDRGMSEDIVQDAFCAVFEQIDKLERIENFEAWVKRIAINKAISMLRKPKTVFIEDNLIEPVAGNETDMDEEMIFQCRVEDVKEAIRNLPDGYRIVISLHLLEGIPQDEIARMLRISHSTVRSQYHRAKQKIFMALKNKTYHEKG